MERLVLALALVLGYGLAASAHEGHDHKIMGTVSGIHEQHLEVKGAKDGKVSSITLNEKAKILREKTALTAADIKVGDRVVVTAVTQKDAAGKEVLVAKEVRLGTAGKPSRPEPLKE